VRQAEEPLSALAWEDYGLVFPNHVGRPIERQNLLRRSFWPLLSRAELPHIRFHDLRHSAATILLAQGVHPKVVQERLGHSTITVTMDIYSHVMPTLQREAANELDRLFARR
jgi:integrase